MSSQVVFNELVSVAHVLQTLQVYAQNKAQLNYIVQHMSFVLLVLQK